MPINVQYLQFKGYAIAPSDVSQGEAESQEISLSKGGRQVKIKIIRKSLEINLRGLTTADAIPFISTAKANVLGLILGGATIENITLGAYTLREAVLVKALPSLPIRVQNWEIIEDLKLEYQSFVYES